MKLLIVNGPNLNLLGKREPGVYGNASFEELFAELKAAFPEVELETLQSNVEGELINFLHGSDGVYDGVVLNAGAYTHTSVALGDAVKAISTPVVEVHMSNIFSREDFRHVSYIAPHCVGSIVGFGMDSYWLAIRWFEKNKS
ncbi:MAG: type II 3-dehydroquinate dehydratase [Bacteroidales bacterium]|nr:type II 3-dehydroquinate dehydratase [Bacteroidales bacterium]